ncbi:cupin domain-containing protein [Pseudofrankia sp. BMG5.37]|uniref:cupin domain-containing protein n=1 Tax=Pseudofrankia sp. BMG5.37 TaxID=3050035 RepID=UPI0028960B9A|nr:cupin domain-containing protein [Pseudofrankia sp. BMG5.37]MDT3444536.1 cupin domain-containing protein [Pseudofrankia sp. BMG5.37]
MRRVIVANVNGVSRVVDDSAPPRSRQAVHTPGFSNTLLWSTPPNASTEYDGTDPTLSAGTFVPAPGGSSLLLLTLPPLAVFQDPGFDREAAAAEHPLISPGIYELMEPDNPGMHTTPSVDYDFLLEGKLTLELTAGEAELNAGDVVVQIGTRHAWRNRSNRVAKLLVVFIGATGTA